MENKQRYSLKKTERLKSRKTIEQLFREGRSFSNFPFRVLWMYTGTPAPILQAGFTVSSRHFKKAVDRNRVKRLMREAYRLQKNELSKKLETLQKNLAIFLIYQGNELPEFELMVEKTGKALKRVQKILDENSLADM